MSSTPAVPTVSSIPPTAPSSPSRTPYLSPAALKEDRTVVPNPADLRLVIEDDRASGSVIYKTVDWRTGEVVQQLPRAEVLKLREAQNYASGQILKSKA